MYADVDDLETSAATVTAATEMRGNSQALPLTFDMGSIAAQPASSARYPHSDPGGSFYVRPSASLTTTQRASPGINTVQYSKPREAETITFRPFPSAQSFEDWKDSARVAVSTASAFGQLAFEWIVQVENKTFDQLEEAGSFTQLDCKILESLDRIIPAGNHYLRSKIRAKRQFLYQHHTKIMTGRQLLRMVYDHFDVASEDRDIVDRRKLQNLKVMNGDVQGFVLKWDETINAMRVCPEPGQLLPYLVIQLDSIPK